ncbi:MAG: DNA repair protein rad50 [Chrysothrix sp. TS-e1954]|nr:MAG: DNA repair protein rad50 [Chrysothrix sp. TS-e1954]
MQVLTLARVQSAKRRQRRLIGSPFLAPPSNSSSVRAFDNTRTENIQFYTPLTLIVGYNGSGKTTIIECLKYATTGDQPPNSKGGAFIHDPKLCGEKEVLAQVRLGFKGTGGAALVTTRSLQLTVKKNARSVKTIDSSLNMWKNGEKTTLSKRNAEIDAIMPDYLGVSKAILDNVIFCHQDESLWPMSEPSVLKKKFDEIFEALKWTKAVDNLKIQRKNQTAKLSNLKTHEQYAKADKEKGEKIEKQSRLLGKEVEDLKVRTQDMYGEVRHAAKEAQDLEVQASQFHKVVAELHGKKIQADAKRETIDDLAQHMRKMTEADVDLKEMLARHEESLQAYDADERSQTDSCHDIATRIEQGRRSLGQKQSEHGRFEAEKEQYERQLQARQSLVKDTARRHGIRGFDYDLDDQKIQDFMDRVNRMAREQNQALESARKEAQEERQRVQATLNGQTESRLSLNQRKEYARSQMATNDKKSNGLSTELGKSGVNEGGRAKLESRMEDIQSDLNTSKEALESAEWDQKIKNAESETSRHEDASEELTSEVAEATKHAGDMAQLDYFRKSLKENERSMDTMTGAHGEKLAEILGAHWQPPSLEEDFRGALERRTEALKDAELQRTNVNRDLEQVDYKLNATRAKLKSDEEERLKQAKAINSVTDDDDTNRYLQVVQEVEQNREIVKKDVDSFSTMHEWYSQCAKTLEKSDKCRLCERSFKSDKERSAFTAKVQALASRAAQEGESELKSMDNDLKSLRAMSGTYESWKRLDQIDIPKLQNEVKSLMPQRDQLLQQAETLDEQLNQKQGSKRNAELLSKTVQQIVRYQTEIASLKVNIESISAKQSQSGRSRTPDEIQTQLRSANESVRSAKGVLATLTRDRDRARTRITELELEFRDVKAELSTVSQQLAEQSRVSTQIEELTKLNDEQRSNVRNIDEDLQKLAPQISQTQAKLEDVNARARSQEQELQSQASKTSESAQQIKLADRDINAYLDKNGPKQLERSNREMQNFLDDIEELEKDQKRVTAAIHKMREQHQDQANVKMDIVRNLKYRENLRALESLQGEIEELQSRNAQVDLDEYNAQAHRWSLERSKLSAEQASMMGELKSKDNELGRLVDEWETSYEHAPKKYKEAHIKVEATKAAIEDLGRCCGALDHGIMEFHKVKMEAINQIIEELWRSTYRGSDVDTVLIKSDNENQKGGKSYNYRVCMIKQDAEMDMRGRCSAGQKVLASIIIRLALAYTFGTNCGIIALDEPTTNLDRDNISSLAKSLHDLIKDRQKQHNFQLIVITHDEDFLRDMQCQDFCDNYYRVSRNNRQKSVIERQSVDGILG